MVIKFVKYQGTGNDFVMVDNRDNLLKLNADIIGKLCDRRKGIGADGVITIQEHKDLDFEMTYYNADGSQSMCGNGSRCAVHFAQSLGMINGTDTNFLSTDGPHYAKIEGDIVHLELADVSGITEYNDSDLFLDTGSPHHIQFVETADNCDVYTQGKSIRHRDIYAPGGTNVNFVEILSNHDIYVRTFERGVEDETLSCGTGVTAASIAATTKNLKSPINITTLGGKLQVKFDNSNGDLFTNVYLIGPATRVFDGEIIL